MDTDRSFIHLFKIKTSDSLIYFFLSSFVFFLTVHTAFLYISLQNRLKKLCPKECVYKLPINTPTHALMHSHTHANSVHPLASQRQAIWQILVRPSPPSQPRRGTFWLKFQWQKRKEKNKKNVGFFFCVCVFLFLEVKTYRVQFGISPGTKTPQQVRVPLFFHSFSSINTVWPLGEKQSRGRGWGIGGGEILIKSALTAALALRKTTRAGLRKNLQAAMTPAESGERARSLGL